MVFKDLRGYLGELEGRGELVRLSEPVSVDLELPALLRNMMYRGGPALLIERTKEGT
ncbi:MAG: UbiD family decarboxylase, partial [Caldivirga sp.]